MKHSSYFDGKVQSLGIDTAEGYATVGVITPGRYTFSTDKEEHMVVTTGSLSVELPDEAPQVVTGGEKFIVPPGQSFDVECTADVSYICYYK